MVNQQNSSASPPTKTCFLCLWYMALADAKSRITKTCHYAGLLQIGSLAMHHVNKFPYPLPISIPASPIFRR